MATTFERILAQLARLHASHVYRSFRRQLDAPQLAQDYALRAALNVVRGSRFARERGLDRVRTSDDLRRSTPLMRYDELGPYIDEVCQGRTDALLAPGVRPLMFATSSGTTSKRKLIPVTPAFVNDYRRGWNIFGLKALSDHPAAFLRHILQSSGRFDESRTRSGVPVGAITGLLARSQKRIVRRYYVGRPEIAEIHEAQARFYTLMRCGVVRDVAWAITANPATLVQLARIASEKSEQLIRDVHDGSLSTECAPSLSPESRRALQLRPDPRRARELERRAAAGNGLRPRDYWRLEFLACWTGGSMSHYLPILREWYGEVPVRDVGLLASEGRVSIPLDDGTTAGVVDARAGFFEFIPAEDFDATAPHTLRLAELEVGRDYAVVLTNTAGLVRYRLDDVVRVRGMIGATPLIEFLYRGGRVASVAGEKLTENQVVAAVRRACEEFGISAFDFIAAPVWADPPFYRIHASAALKLEMSELIDRALGLENEEYLSRRKSLRLGPLVITEAPREAFSRLDRRLLVGRESMAEQYKRPCLLVKPGDDIAALRPD
ncbi:MAG: GH3 auxin-responsive promoter family protein [Phycisphaerae bacterium]